MARPNNRSKILDAAARVVARDGAARLTLEATADEAGLTRGGMMYHFADRDALVLALQQHEAARWEERMVECAGAPADELSADERIAAYVRVSVESPSRAEFALAVEATTDPALAAPWTAVQRRWSPSPAEALADPAAFDRFVLRLASDGLWAYDSLSDDPLPPGLRAALAERIATLRAQPPSDSPH